MKIKTVFGSLVALILALCLCMPCMATNSLSLPDHQMTVEIPDQFSVIHRNNLPKQEELLSQFGTTVTDTDLKFTRDGYLFLAISTTMRCTMFMSQSVSSVTRTIGDLITCTNKADARRLLLGDSLPQQAVVQEIEQRGALFFRVDFGVTDGVGRIAYFTVMNGTAYTLCVVDNNGNLSQNVNNALDFTFESWQYTVHAEQEKIQSFRQKAGTVIRWVLIPLLVVAAAFVLRMVVKDLRKRRLEENRRNVIPKKPRR